MPPRSSACFFFTQKTAYELTYGDWSSDVCSSDLPPPRRSRRWRRPAARSPWARTTWPRTRSEERRVGKSVVGCVDLGGRRSIKKKKKRRKKKEMGEDSAGDRHLGGEHD